LSRLKGWHLLLLLYVVTMAVVFRPILHGWDGAAYYSWLRSAVIDGNLDTGDEIKHYEALQETDVQSQRWTDDRGRSATGLWINHWPVGSAILWAPFFLVAHGALRVGGEAFAAFPADGYSAPYIWLVLLGTTLWGLTGLLLMYRVARRLYSDFAATLAAALALLATPLVFYMFVSPAMAHANEVFANALFVWIWFVTRKKRGATGWLMLGAAVGLAAMVRNQNALLIVFPGLELAAQGLSSLARRDGKGMTTTIGHGLAMACGAALAFAPQMVVWQAVFGAPILNPQAASSGLGFNWAAPHLWDALFSNRGVFVWHPVLLVGAIGLLALARSDRRLAAMLACNLLLQTYLIGSWDAWDGTPAFGARYFLCMLPAFQLGLTAAISAARRRVPALALAGIGGLLVVWNAGLLAQYALQLIPRGGSVSVQQMVMNQFQVVPGYIGKAAGVILSRFGR
jgi:hypothetical protein